MVLALLRESYRGITKKYDNYIFFKREVDGDTNRKMSTSKHKITPKPQLVQAVGRMGSILENYYSNGLRQFSSKIRWSLKGSTSHIEIKSWTHSRRNE